MKNIIIFDLDGTLALIDHRRHLVEKRMLQDVNGFIFADPNWKPDWDKFYDLCDEDSPNIPVIEVYNGFYTSPHTDWIIYIFSGRSETVRGKTTEWLNYNNVFIPEEHLLMRPDKDFTPDEELKKKWLQQIGGPDKVFCVFDDRDKVVAMWRSLGITCFQVAPGNF